MWNLGSFVSITVAWLTGITNHRTCGWDHLILFSSSWTIRWLWLQQGTQMRLTREALSWTLPKLLVIKSGASEILSVSHYILRSFTIKEERTHTRIFMNDFKWTDKWFHRWKNIFLLFCFETVHILPVRVLNGEEEGKDMVPSVKNWSFTQSINIWYKRENFFNTCNGQVKILLLVHTHTHTHTHTHAHTHTTFSKFTK